MRRGQRWDSKYFDAFAIDVADVKKEDEVVRLDRPFDSLGAAALLGVGPVVFAEEEVAVLGEIDASRKVTGDGENAENGDGLGAEIGQDAELKAETTSVVSTSQEEGSRLEVGE